MSQKIKKPHWGPWQAILDAAAKSDPYCGVVLFMEAVVVASKARITIEEAAEQIKATILDLFAQFDYSCAYTESELSAILRNIAAAKPTPELRRQRMSAIPAFA